MYKLICVTLILVLFDGKGQRKGRTGMGGEGNRRERKREVDKITVHLIFT